jgi:hypothetical protein
MNNSQGYQGYYGAQDKSKPPRDYQYNLNIEQKHHSEIGYQGQYSPLEILEHKKRTEQIVESLCLK